MLNTVDGPSESVEDYLCDPEEMPLGARESRLPCPEDCVLNDWGPWSRCSMVRAWSRTGKRPAQIRPEKVGEAHRDLSWYLLLCHKHRPPEARRIQSCGCYCERRVNLCQQVISRPARRIKEDPGENGFCITYIPLGSVCVQQGGRMIYDEEPQLSNSHLMMQTPACRPEIICPVWEHHLAVSHKNEK